jgi:hypothetical protein
MFSFFFLKKLAARKPFQFSSIREVTIKIFINYFPVITSQFLVSWNFWNSFFCSGEPSKNVRSPFISTLKEHS